MNDERSTRSSNPLPGHLPVRMRGPADMAELLPYLLGFFPDDSIVAVGLQGADLEQGGVIRIDIPEATEDWPEAAADAAGLLIQLSEQRGRKPDQVLLYLCQDPAPGSGGPGGAAAAGAGPMAAEPGEGGESVVERLGPLAGELRAAFELRGVTVKESLCVSDGRWWSFLCRRTGCCEPAGTPVRRAGGPGPVVAAATFAGLAPRGSRKAIVAGLAPITEPGARAQRLALDGVARRGGERGESFRERAGAVLDEVMAEFVAGARETDEHRAALLLEGLQDKLLRDRAAEYAEPAELGAAQRLWRFLAQRCVTPYEGHASPPLTLLAWTSWLAGDGATARIVLSCVLKIDPYYLLAQLLYESLNAGLPPDLLLEGVRAERARRRAAPPRRRAGPPPEPGAPGGAVPAPRPPAEEGGWAGPADSGFQRDARGHGHGPGVKKGVGRGAPQESDQSLEQAPVRPSGPSGGHGPGSAAGPGRARLPEPATGAPPVVARPSSRRRVRLHRRMVGGAASPLAAGPVAGFPAGGTGGTDSPPGRAEYGPHDAPGGQ